MKNLYAERILDEYVQTNHKVVNTYCQLRDHHPFEDLSEYAKAVWRVQMLVEIWDDIALLVHDETVFGIGEIDEN